MIRDTLRRPPQGTVPSDPILPTGLGQGLVQTHTGRERLHRAVLPQVPILRREVLSRCMVHIGPRNGFLFPDEVIRRQHSACLFRPWTEPMDLEDLRAQVRKRKLDRYERIIVMGGRRFIILVEDAFHGRKVRAPLAGVGGIGEMMHEINLALSTGHRL